MNKLEEMPTDTFEGKNRVLLVAKLGLPLEYKSRTGKWLHSSLGLNTTILPAPSTVYRIKK